MYYQYVGNHILAFIWCYLICKIKHYFKLKDWGHDLLAVVKVKGQILVVIFCCLSDLYMTMSVSLSVYISLIFIHEELHVYILKMVKERNLIFRGSTSMTLTPHNLERSNKPLF